MEPRYGCFEIRTACSHCGNPLVLNGPQTKPKCDSCLEIVDVAPPLWKTWLEDLLEDYGGLDWKHGASSTIMSGGFTAKVNYYRLKPRCPECKEDLGVEIQAGTDQVLHCAACANGTLDTFPAPEWLTSVLPAAEQVYGAQREVEKRSEMESAAKPIVMTCPQCGGTLKATSDTERVMPCAYCDVDVYLPDAVWRKLHPARTIHEWFVRFKPKAAPKPKEKEEEEPEPADVSSPFEAHTPPPAPGSVDPDTRRERQVFQARKAAVWLAIIGILFGAGAATIFVASQRVTGSGILILISGLVFLGVAVERWAASVRMSTS